MVGKILTRESFGRTIEYNVKKIDNNEQVGALDYNFKKSELFHTNMIGEHKTFTTQMQVVANLNSRIKKPVKHFVLSFAPDDEKKITKELCKEIVDNYLKRMGYGNNQFCAFIHKDTDNLHIHIVCNRVSYDGTVVKNSNDMYTSRKILNEIERQYGFVQTSKAKKSSYQSYKVSNNYFENKNLGEEDKIKFMREHVRFALKQHPITFEMFRDLLAEKQIEVKITQNQKGLEYISGDFKIYGSQLNKLYSLPHINAQLRKNSIYQFRKVLNESLQTKPVSFEMLFEELNRRGFAAKLNKARNGWFIEKEGIRLKGSELGRMSFEKIKEHVENNLKFSEERQLQQALQQGHKEISQDIKQSLYIPRLGGTGASSDREYEEEERRRKQNRSGSYEQEMQLLWHDR